MNTQNTLKERILTDRERKNINILDLIRKNGPIAKTEISRLTGLNIVTVSNYIENFIEKKFVYEKGLDISTGGRRPILVDLNSDIKYVAGVAITMFHVSSLITDLRGNVIKKVQVERPVESGENLIDEMLNVTNKLLEEIDIPKENIAGIGLGVPGILDTKANTIRWRDRQTGNEVTVNVSLIEKFEEKFNIPTFVESDATAAVFGEKWYALDSNIRHMLYMYSSTSCGMIVNGEIYHGVSGNAGEIGIFNERVTDSDKCDMGIQLNRFEIDAFIIKEAQQAWENNYKRDSKIFEEVDNDISKITPNVILKQLKQLDKLSIEIIENAGIFFGKKLAFLTNLLNPEVVVVGGGIEQAGSIFLDSVKKTVNRWSIDEATSGLKIIPTQLGESAVCLGAASIVVENIFAQI